MFVVRPRRNRSPIMFEKATLNQDLFLAVQTNNQMYHNLTTMD